MPLSTRRAAGQARLRGAGDQKRRSSLPTLSVYYKPENLRGAAQAQARHLRPRGILSWPAVTPPWRPCQRLRQIPPGHAEGQRIWLLGGPSAAAVGILSTSGGTQRHASEEWWGCLPGCRANWRKHGCMHMAGVILRLRRLRDDLDIDDVPVLERQQVARQRQASGATALFQSAGAAFPVH